LFYSYLSIYLRFFLGLSVTETTLFATLPMICNVLSQNFLWGQLSDRLQLRRTLIIIGEVSAAIITYIAWYVHTIPDDKIAAGYVLIIGLSIVEISWSMSNVGWTALLSDLYPAEERAGLQGKMQSFGAVGRFVGIWIGGLLYSGLPFKYEGWGFYEGWLFYIAIAVMLLSTIPMLFTPEGGVKKKEPDPAADSGDRTSPQKKQTGKISRQYLFFLIAMVLIFFGMNSIVLLKSQYLSLDGGFDVSSRTLSYIVNMATIAIFFTGLMIKRLAIWLKDETLLMIGIGVAILYLLGYSLAPRLGFIYLAEVCSGAAMSIIMASSYAYASRLIPPHKRGKQFALYNSAFFLSWGLPGTIIAGPLVDYLISSGTSDLMAYKAAFVVAAIMMLIGSVVLAYTVRMKSEDIVMDD
jgi:MFS family permease